MLPPHLPHTWPSALPLACSTPGQRQLAPIQCFQVSRADLPAGCQWSSASASVEEWEMGRGGGMDPHCCITPWAMLLLVVAHLQARSHFVAADCAEVVPARLRTFIYAFDRSFEMAVAACAAPVVAKLAESYFGFDVSAAIWTLTYQLDQNAIVPSFCPVTKSRDSTCIWLCVSCFFSGR